MPVIRRILHFLVVTFCVVGAGAVIALWNRSYTRSDIFHWVQWQSQAGQMRAELTGIELGMGGIQYVSEQSHWIDDPELLQLLRDAANRFQRNGRVYRTTRPIVNLIRDSDSLVSALGFEYRRLPPDELRFTRLEVVLPYWFILVSLVAYPIGRYIRNVLSRHRAETFTHNLCPRCGEALPAGATHCSVCDRPVVVLTET